jgi:hypothetical protein
MNIKQWKEKALALPEPKRSLLEIALGTMPKEYLQFAACRGELSKNILCTAVTQIEEGKALMDIIQALSDLVAKELALVEKEIKARKLTRSSAD